MPIRIVWDVQRYYGIKIPDAGGYRILKCNGLNRLSGGIRVRKIHTKWYNKQVPGHHIQMDARYLPFAGKGSEKIRRFLSTAIDDATRIRACKICNRRS